SGSAGTGSGGMYYHPFGMMISIEHNSVLWLAFLSFREYIPDVPQLAGGAVEPRTSRAGGSRWSSAGRAGSATRASRVRAASPPASKLALSTLVSQIDRSRASYVLDKPTSESLPGTSTFISEAA